MGCRAPPVGSPARPRRSCSCCSSKANQRVRAATAESNTAHSDRTALQAVLPAVLVVFPKDHDDAPLEHVIPAARPVRLHGRNDSCHFCACCLRFADADALAKDCPVCGSWRMVEDSCSLRILRGRIGACTAAARSNRFCKPRCIRKEKPSPAPEANVNSCPCTCRPLWKTPRPRVKRVSFAGDRS